MTIENENDVVETEDLEVSGDSAIHDVREAFKALREGGDDGGEVVAEVKQPAVEAGGEGTLGEKQPVAEPEAKPAQEIAPPTSWDAAAKAEWAAVSPAIRQAVAKREAEMSDGIKRYADTLAPVTQMAREKGIDPKIAVENLVAWQTYFERDPENALAAMAERLGVKLGASSDQKEGPDFTQHLRPLAERLHSIESTIERRERMEREARESESRNHVESFADQNPHFDDVKDELIAIIPMLKDQNPHWTRDQVLKEAYDRATRANPTVWSKIRAEETKAAMEKRTADQKARVGASKQAAVSIKGSPSSGGSAPSESVGSAYDDVRAAFAALRG